MVLSSRRRPLAVRGPREGAAAAHGAGEGRRWRWRTGPGRGGTGAGPGDLDGGGGGGGARGAAVLRWRRGGFGGVRASAAGAAVWGVWLGHGC
jgi:hypothetical protein